MNSGIDAEMAELMELHASLGSILGRINSLVYRWSMIQPEPVTVVELPVYPQPVFQAPLPEEPSNFIPKAVLPPIVPAVAPAAPVTAESIANFGQPSPVAPVCGVLPVQPATHAGVTVGAPVGKTGPVRPIPIRPAAKKVSDYNARLSRILNS